MDAGATARCPRFMLVPSGADRAAAMETEKPFPLALRELVTESDYVTQAGTPNWAEEQ